MHLSLLDHWMVRSALQLAKAAVLSCVTVSGRERVHMEEQSAKQLSVTRSSPAGSRISFRARCGARCAVRCARAADAACAVW
eukprot:scaffold106323_cov28-Tisochrysis_lutea.AAC.3